MVHQEADEHGPEGWEVTELYWVAGEDCYGGRPIAEFDAGMDPRGQEELANLVSAAPDLLKAARMTVAFLNGESHLYPKWVAEAAIAKAEGR